jgi:uncharacterized protein with ATP-grasp and redox domains
MMEKFAEFDISILFNISTDERKLENIAPANSIVSIMDAAAECNFDKFMPHKLMSIWKLK